MTRGPAIGDAALALGLAVLVTAVEYFFRHYVLFWMPTIGTLQVNDMIALALAYSSLTVAVGSAAGIDWRAERIALGQSFWEFVTQWRFTAWILGLMLSLVALSVVDHWLWGGFRLPMWVSAYRNPTVWLASSAAFLAPIALICVNAIVVPVAEEYLWRGQIQARLLRAAPAAAAIGVTAVLFSLKHALVDASLGRLVSLTAFGAICGIVALRHSWRTSAALHMIVNTAATTVSLL